MYLILRIYKPINGGCPDFVLPLCPLRTHPQYSYRSTKSLSLYLFYTAAANPQEEHQAVRSSEDIVSNLWNYNVALQIKKTFSFMKGAALKRCIHIFEHPKPLCKEIFNIELDPLGLITIAKSRRTA